MTLRKVRLDPVQRGEEDLNILFVRFLCGCEAGFVDAVVDVVVGPVVGGFDFGPEGGWEEVELLVFFGEEVIEFVIEHADDFGALGGMDVRLGTVFLESEERKKKKCWEPTSLLTIRFVFLSYKVGTVNRPLYSGSTEK